MSDPSPQHASRTIAGDWYDSAVPDNVVFDSTNFIETSYSFRRLRSSLEQAVTLGRGAAVYARTSFNLGPNASVEIGAFTMINGAEIICDGRIEIGDYGLISWNVLFMDTYRAPRAIRNRRAYLDLLLKNDERALALQDAPKAIHIGPNVWIGHDSVVLPGVSIGKGSIVGARSVVADSIPDFAVAVGNPARVIRNLET